MCIMLNKKHHKYMRTAIDTIRTLGIKTTVLSPSVLEVNTSPSKSTLSLVGVSHSITAATPTCR